MPYTYDYPRPTVTADAAVFRDTGQGPEVLLVKRGNPPFEGMWAIPGGFIGMDEPLEDAAHRELEEETGLKNVDLKQYGTYGDVHRDPRHRTITVAYTGCIGNSDMKATAGDDAADCHWYCINELPELAFDHHLLVADAIAFAKKEGWF